MSFFKNYYKCCFDKLGRLNRKDFFFSFLKAYLVFSFISFYLMLVPFGFLKSLVFISLVFPIMIFYLIPIGVIIVPGHDMDLRGWLFVWVVAVIIYLILLKKSHTKD